MTAAAGTGRGSAVVLTDTECLTLLRSHSIGRLGWGTGHELQILPVTYVLQSRSILFRTSPDAALADLRGGQPVAFEIDELDATTRTGWSVLVQGQARAVEDPELLSRLRLQPQPLPWTPGVRDLAITVSVDRLSGRRFSP